MKKQTKNKNAKSIDEKLKTKGLMFFVSFFHVICKISNFNILTAKHLALASCTELALPKHSNKLTKIGHNFRKDKVIPEVSLSAAKVALLIACAT